MVNIYTNKNSIPKDKELIFDVDKFFFDVDIDYSDQFANEVFSIIEDGKPLDSICFIDRFGIKTSIEFISTSSKCLLCAKFGPTGCVYNFNEVGVNLFNMLDDVDECSVFCDRDNIELGILGKVCVNGIQFECGDDAMFYIDMGEVPSYYNETDY